MVYNIKPRLQLEMTIDISLKRLIDGVYYLSHWECLFGYFPLQTYWQLKWADLVTRPSCLIGPPALLACLPF
jgi:hypothetical protein